MNPKIQIDKSSGQSVWLAFVLHGDTYECYVSPDTTRAQIVDRLTRVFAMAWGSNPSAPELTIEALHAVFALARAVIAAREKIGHPWFSEATIASEAFAAGERKRDERQRDRLIEVAA